MNTFLIKDNQFNLYVLFMPDIYALLHNEFKHTVSNHSNSGAFEEWYTVMRFSRPSWVVTKSGAIVHISGNEQYTMLESENVHDAIRQYERIINEDIINTGVGGFDVDCCA